jgi:hypothetical protein
VALLIDRSPLHCWVDNTQTPSIQHWSVRLPVYVSPAGSSPVLLTQAQSWVLDTAFAGEAFGWRHHLEDAGIDPDTDRLKPRYLRWTAGSTAILTPAREADLWLLSNIPGQSPQYLPLLRGIRFRDQRVATPDLEFHRALVGLRPLIRAGLKFELDFAGCTVSVWTP